MDVKKLFRRSKTPDGKSPDGKSRRNRLSFGGQSTSRADMRASSSNEGRHSAASEAASGVSPPTSDLNASQDNDEMGLHAPPVPRLPDSVKSEGADLPADGLPIAARYTSKAYYRLPTSPPAPLFGIEVRRSNTVSTRDSNGSAIIPGRYDHDRARRTASLRHPADRPIVVEDTVALGTKKAPNFVSKTPQAPSTPLQSPVSPRPGLSQHPVSPQDYSMNRHRRNPTQDTADDVASFEDAAEELPARTPLLESDTVPGFLTPGGSAAQTPAIERIINHREAIDGDPSLPESHSDPTTRPDAANLPLHPVGGNTGSPHPPDLEGIVDLRNTVDTDVQTQWADPVVHETVQPRVEHITHEFYDRDIHHHHVQHRLLPIQDVQQLPARHFVPHGPNGELIEVDESQIPGRTGPNASWAVQQTTPSRGGDLLGQEEGRGEEQYASRYVNQEGVPTTEQVWKHPPRISDGTPDNTRDWPLSNGGGAVNATQAVAGAMASKLPHEQQAEQTVESHKQASHTGPGGGPASGTSLAKDLAYRTKPAVQREHEAEATIAAVRAAAKHQ